MSIIYLVQYNPYYCVTVTRSKFPPCNTRVPAFISPYNILPCTTDSRFWWCCQMLLIRGKNCKIGSQWMQGYAISQEDFASNQVSLFFLGTKLLLPVRKQRCQGMLIYVFFINNAVQVRSIWYQIQVISLHQLILP